VAKKLADLQTSPRPRNSSKLFRLALRHRHIARKMDPSRFHFALKDFLSDFRPAGNDLHGLFINVRKHSKFESVSLLSC